MLRTNVDAILETLNADTLTPISKISKSLNIPEDTIEKVAKYLEEEGIVRMQYKLFAPYIILASEGGKEKGVVGDKKPEKIAHRLSLKNLFGKKAEKKPEEEKTKKIAEQRAGEKTPEETKKTPEQTNYEKKVVKIMDQIEQSIKKRELIKACDLYMEAADLLNKGQIIEEKHLKRMDKIYEIIAKA